MATLSLEENCWAFFTVWSLEWPSTRMTSKSEKDWWMRSVRRRGKNFSSLRAGMMIE